MAALAVTGAVFLSGQPRLIRPVLIGFTVLCLADWVLIEDFGFFGGLGTDPNSMIPLCCWPSPDTSPWPATLPSRQNRRAAQAADSSQLAGAAPGGRRAAEPGIGGHPGQSRPSARSA